MPADGVALEICTVWIPAHDSQFHDDLWRDVDEQHLSAALRRRLSQNGFRAGRVAGRVPPSIQKLIDAHAPQRLEGGWTLSAVDPLPRFESERRHARAGHTAELVVSEIAHRWPVLFRDEQGNVKGANLLRPQAVFQITALPQGDGRARLRLLPEVQHGEAHLQSSAAGGVLTLLPGRPAKKFAHLEIEATLAPGDVLLVGKLPERPGTLGHHFFASGSDREREKLILVRLAQTQYDDLFQRPPATAAGAEPGLASDLGPAVEPRRDPPGTVPEGG
jgi:hypothetical protein